MSVKGDKAFNTFLLIGPGRIGSVFARLARNAGDRIGGIVASSTASAERHAQLLRNPAALEAPIGYPSVEVATGSQTFDGCILSCPESVRGPILDLLLPTNIPILCEKPLLPNKTDTGGDAYRRLTSFGASTHPYPFIFNASNHHFMDAIEWRHEKEDFFFRFHTNGPHRGADILMDLMPHCVSFLQSLWGKAPVKPGKISITENSATGDFQYADHTVHFDFCEGPATAKALAFGFEQEFYQRIQEGFGDTYKVYMEGPYPTMDFGRGPTVTRHQCQDPFAISFDRFRKTVRDHAGDGGDLELAIANFEICEALMNRHHTESQRHEPA